MKAKAPGKLVLSGAYAVLEGAPALVLAADRYVIADASREASYEAEEVLAAVALGMIERPIWYDVSALRTADAEGGRKLGLGSSAAIVSASIGACRLAAGESPVGLGERVFPDALRAHRKAQPRGSGIDVAASCFGGMVACSLDLNHPERPLYARQQALLPNLTIEVFASHKAASTAGMLAAIAKLRERQPGLVEWLLDAAGTASHGALEAADIASFTHALRQQYQALGRLGEAAGIDIVGADSEALDRLAREVGASFGPSGAGGGDVALYVGEAPSSANFRSGAERHGMTRLSLRLAVSGLQACNSAAGERGVALV